MLPNATALTGGGLFKRHSMNVITVAASRSSPPLTLPLDEALLRQASLRANGATVHAACGLVSLYRLAHRAGLQHEFKDAERRLRQFVLTGVIPKH